MTDALRFRNVVAIGVALMLLRRSRSFQRGVIDEPDNELVFNGNAGFRRLSFLVSNS